jgi:7-cyano-7-deazaguanine synthase
MVVDELNGGQEEVTAVLCSGGLDSVVLVAQEATSRRVQPVYVSSGFSWEFEESERLPRLLKASVFTKRVREIAWLECPITDTYPKTHWALTGKPPAYATSDSDVYLIGRNVMLLTKIGTYCVLQGISRIAIGSLVGNPFPDATPSFLEAMSKALSLGLDEQIEIVAPFAEFTKNEVIKIGNELGVPLELTLSCMNPVRSSHCGRCSKCRERLQAFSVAGFEDIADYDFRPSDVSTGL